MDESPEYDAAFARVAVSLGLISSRRFKAPSPGDPKPTPWKDLATENQLDEKAVAEVQSQVVRLAEVCKRCRSIRYREALGIPLRSDCPQCSHKGKDLSQESKPPEPPTPSSTPKSPSAKGYPMPFDKARRPRPSLDADEPTAAEIRREELLKAPPPPPSKADKHAARLAAMTLKKALDKDGSQSESRRERAIRVALHPGIWATVFALLAAIAAYWVWASGRPVRLEAGVLAPSAPAQTAAPTAPPWTWPPYSLTAVAQYSGKAKILCKAAVDAPWSDSGAQAWVLGWGPLSDQSVVDRMSFAIAKKSYTWTGTAKGLDAEEIQFYSALIWAIPAGPTERRAIAGLRQGHIFEFQGQFVDVTGNQQTWTTTLPSVKSAEPAPAILWVESLKIAP